MNTYGGFITVYPKDAYGNDCYYSAKAEITVKGNEGPIYRDSTECSQIAEYGTEASKTGFGGGATAEIIIACVVVVAVAGFCVYWFIFREKSDSSAPEA